MNLVSKMRDQQQKHYGMMNYACENTEGDPSTVKLYRSMHRGFQKEVAARHMHLQFFAARFRSVTYHVFVLNVYAEHRP